MPQGDLLGNFAVGDPRFQELKESRTGDLFPLDSQTGAAVATQDGIEPPNLGSDSHQWGRIYAKGVVIGGVEVAISDIANFAPIVLTRAADAPATGQHDQTFAWPFIDLHSAFLIVVGPQTGGAGSGGGIYANPGTGAIHPFGIGSQFDSALGYESGYALTADDISQFGLSGGDGWAYQRTTLLSGLSQGDVFSLEFGKGGAGGAGSVSGATPLTTDNDSVYLWGPTQSYGSDGVGGVGFTAFSGGGLVVPVQNTGGVIERARVGTTTLPINSRAMHFYRGSFAGVAYTVPFGRAYTGDSFTPGIPSIVGNPPSIFGGRVILSGVLYGAGGAAPPPISTLTSSVAQSAPGNPGGTGHDGFVLIFPRP